MAVAVGRFSCPSVYPLLQEILPQEAIVRLTTAQTIPMQETFPQLPTASRLTRRPFKTHFHHCRHQCLLSVHSNVNWTQALDLHRLLSRGLVALHGYCLGCGERIDSGWFGGSLLCGYYSLGSDKGFGMTSDEPHLLCG